MKHEKQLEFLLVAAFVHLTDWLPTESAYRLELLQSSTHPVMWEIAIVKLFSITKLCLYVS